ncbi:MAG: hypothetical protein AB8G05_15765 [Oligoflexales bacterium]
MRYTFIISICFFACSFSHIPYAIAHGNQTGNHHHDKTIDLGKSSPVTLSVKAIEDTMDGWNLQIEVSNFDFSPENTGKTHKVGEGHANLYVNARQVARLYGPWFHLSKKLLMKGKNTILVRLNANSHEKLLVNGKELSQKIYLNYSK